MLLYYSTDKKDKGRRSLFLFCKKYEDNAPKISGYFGNKRLRMSRDFTFRGGNADLVDRAIDSGVSKNVVALPFYSPT